MSSHVELRDPGPAFLERHRVVTIAVGLVLLVLAGVALGELVGTVVARVVDLGLGAVIEGGSR
jgi:uncharacterized membrane protein HdeD (DUF308 family)